MTTQPAAFPKRSPPARRREALSGGVENTGRLADFAESTVRQSDAEQGGTLIALLPLFAVDGGHAAQAAIIPSGSAAGSLEF